MTSISQHLISQGVDPCAVKLQATLQHIAAGEKEHYTGVLVQEFKPVITTLDFVHEPTGQCLFKITNAGKRLDDKEAYWAQMAVPTGIDPEHAKALMCGFLDHYRTLSGNLDSAYDMIEIDPAIIAGLLRKSERMELDFSALNRFIELDDQIFNSICDRERSPEREAELEQLTFEKFTFTSEFKQNPCTQEFLTGLRQEYIEGHYHAVGFDNFYDWFHKSTMMFDDAGQIKEDAKIGFERAVAAWTAAGGEPTQEWIEDKQYWARRNFEVHPRHAHLIDAFIREIALEFVASANKNPRAGL